MIPPKRNLRPLLISCICGLLFSSQSLGQESAAEPTVPSGFGFLVIRLVGLGDEIDANIEFKNQEKDFAVMVRSRECRPAGAKARLCLVYAMPGRYFWRKYETEFRVRMGLSNIQDPPIIRSKPGSASDTFAVVSGAINYAGDWDFSVRSGDSLHDRRLSVDTRQNPATLQMLFEIFPDYANRYGIYLSMMGKKAISLQEFLKIIEENSE